MKPSFPVARFLLARFVSGDALESIGGDLDEEYALHVRPARGRFAAWLWYWRQTVRSIRDRRPPRDPRAPRRGTIPWRRSFAQAWRTLRASPATTGIAVATMALGIGATAIVFSVVNTMLLRPLPYGEADRLVMVWDTNPQQGFPTMGPTPANYLDWRQRSRAMERLAALAPYTATLTGLGDPLRVDGQRVAWETFELLQVPAALGRRFLADDDVPGNEVVIVSHRFWRDVLGADPDAIGRRLMLGNRPRTVVGVMPAGFRLPPVSWTPGQVDDVWVPLAFTDEERARRGSHYLTVIGRLRPGITLAQAREDMDRVAADLAAEHPQRNAGLGVLLRPMRAQFTERLDDPLRLFAGATALLLLVACVNVASLLVGRGSTRRRELSVRAALGATPRQLAAQLLVEGAVLAAAGGAAGCLLAAAGLPALVARMPAGLLPLEPAGLDWRSAAFAAVVTAGIALVCGAAPMVHLRRLAAGRALHDGARQPPGASGRRLRSGLVVAQVALACFLLVGAGLLIRSFLHLVSVDPGFRTEGLLTLHVELPRSRYRGPAEWTTYFDEALERVTALPGVEAAGAISWLPLTTRGNSNAVRADHQPPPAPGESVFANYRLVTPGYFEAMGARLRRGRWIDAGDRAGTARVAVVNETMAARFWPGQDPIGRRITFRPADPDESSWLTVVGVVGDTAQGALSDPVAMELFAPYGQDPYWFPPSDLVVRSSGEAATLAAAVKAVVQAVDATVPIVRVRPMRAVVATSVAEPRFVLLLVGLFAATAVTLAAIGLYGLVSYAVAQRTRELGVRTALGAQPAAVLGLVLRQGFGLSVLGAAIGALAALVGARWLEPHLFGIAPTDPATFGTAIAGLLGLALAACAGPARRALRVSPVVALRVD